MICLLINYYWALYLGGKIHLHWNKCQGMAREFILFVPICHWIGGKTAVPFKTSSGLLTVCRRRKMKTSGEWGADTDPCDLEVCCSSYFLPGTPPYFLLWIPEFKTPRPPSPHMDMRLSWILNISVGSCACPSWEKGKKSVGHPFIHYHGPGKDCESLTLHGLHQRLATQVKGNSLREKIGYGGRDSDSRFTCFTTCVTFSKTNNNSGPCFPHLWNGWFGQETFSSPVFLWNTSFQTHFYLKFHYVVQSKEKLLQWKQSASPFLVFSYLLGTPKSLLEL